MGIFGSGKKQAADSKRRQQAFKAGKRSSGKAAEEYAQTARRRADFKARKQAAAKHRRSS